MSNFHQKSTVAIVVLNWNGVLLLKQFLPPLLDSLQLPNQRLWVIDNASTDGSWEYLQGITASGGAQAIRLETNKGYAGGYMDGLKQIEIEADYYVLLNSDVLITNKCWIDPMVDLLDHNSMIAACQPKVLAHSNPQEYEYAGAAGGVIDLLGYPFCRGRIFEVVEQDMGQYNDSCPIFWASGACLFVRSTAFWQVGGFDENFFAHMEEIDLCWRLQNAGYEVWYCAQSEILHVGGGTLTYGTPQKTFLNFRNSLVCLQKNLPTVQAFVAILFRLVLDGVAGLKMLFEGNYKHTLAILKAHYCFYKNQAKWLAKRRLIPTKKPIGQLKGVYSGLIVWSFFLQKKHKYTDLN